MDRFGTWREALLHRAEHGTALSHSASGDCPGSAVQRTADRDEYRLRHEAHVRLPQHVYLRRRRTAMLQDLEHGSLRGQVGRQAETGGRRHDCLDDPGASAGDELQGPQDYPAQRSRTDLRPCQSPPCRHRLQQAHEQLQLCPRSHGAPA